MNHTPRYLPQAKQKFKIIDDVKENLLSFVFVSNICLVVCMSVNLVVHLSVSPVVPLSVSSVTFLSVRPVFFCLLVLSSNLSENLSVNLTVHESPVSLMV